MFCCARKICIFFAFLEIRIAFELMIYLVMWLFIYSSDERHLEDLYLNIECLFYGLLIPWITIDGPNYCY